MNRVFGSPLWAVCLMFVYVSMLALASQSADSADPAPEKPNIVFIMADDK